MKKFAALILAIMLVITSGTEAHAQALDVATAKAQGLIGEQTDGLLGIVTGTPSMEVTALVEKTNSERMAIYKDMAEKQRIDINQIKMMAAQKLFQLEKPGNYIKYSASQWKKKSP